MILTTFKRTYSSRRPRLLDVIETLARIHKACEAAVICTPRLLCDNHNAGIGPRLISSMRVPHASVM